MQRQLIVLEIVAIFYLIIGGLIYSKLEGWTFNDAGILKKKKKKKKKNFIYLIKIYIYIYIFFFFESKVITININYY